MGKIVLSFIIPMFNAEKYIEKCIQSINSQGIDNNEYEIIVVDDGSSDGGGEIVKQLDQVIYFRQNNSGQSAARNKGIELAQGEYICFIDADDVLVRDSFKFCLKTAIGNSLDMITYEMVGCPDDTKIPIITNQTEQLDAIITGAEYIERYNFNNGPCWYLIKKESLDNIRFINGRYGEDGMFTMELLMRIKRIAHTSRKCYCYVRHPNTTTTRRSVEHQKKMIGDYMFVYHHMKDLIENNESNLSEKAKERCNKRAESYVFFLLIRLLKYTGDRQFIKEMIQELRSERVYPVTKPYPGFRYEVSSLIVNHYPLLIFTNFIYKAASRISKRG